MAYQPTIYGVVSSLNSSSTNLALNAVFTGTGEDVTIFANVKISIFSSGVSAIDGLQIQQSPNNIDWDASDTYTIPATTNRAFSVPVNNKFFRIVYTNGAVATTSFRLQVIYNAQDKQPSSVRPQDGRANDNDFVEMLGFLMGYNSVTNTWNRIGITNAVTGGNENLIDRIKVNAALRMLDNAQPSGSKLVNVTGTATKGLDVNVTELKAATLAVTVTAAAGTAATLTLPAVAGLFHYITALDIVLYSSAARVGAAAPTVVTTTNLPGAIAFTFSTAGAIGTTDVQDLIRTTPLKSSVVNTATTIVCPIAAGGIWRITATYFTGV